MDEKRTILAEILKKTRAGIYRVESIFDKKKQGFYTKECPLFCYFYPNEVEKGIVGYYSSKNDDLQDEPQSIRASSMFNVQNPIISEKAKEILDKFERDGFCVNLGKNSIYLRVGLKLENLKSIGFDFSVEDYLEKIDPNVLIQNRDEIIQEVSSKARTGRVDVYIPKNPPFNFYYEELFYSLVDTMQKDNNMENQ